MKEEINFDTIAMKILNELKYNKRMFVMWQSLFKDIKIRNDEDILEYLTSLINKIWNQSFTAVNNTSRQLPLFKKIGQGNEEAENIKSSESDLNILSFDRNKKIDIHSIVYNEFIDVDLEMFILSVLWVEKVGKVLDKELSEEVYANRVSSKKILFLNCILLHILIIEILHLRQWII